jgi:hypothetical protein
MTRHEGGCLCGAVRFALSADPLRVTVCHCHFCQRNTGTAYLVEPVFAKTEFQITSGTPKTHDLVSEGKRQARDHPLFAAHAVPGCC